MTERTPDGQPEQEPDVPAAATPPTPPPPTSPAPPPGGTGPDATRADDDALAPGGRPLGTAATAGTAGAAAAGGAAGAAGAVGAAGAARTAGATGPGDDSGMWAAPAEGVPGEHGAHGAHDLDEHGHPREPVANTGVAATFLPGLEALSVLAVLVSVFAAGVYLLLYPLIQAANGGKTWADFRNKVPQTQQDPFSLQRLYLEYQSWGHIILGLVAMLLALVVLGLWNPGKHRFWARSLAQAALVFGFCVVVYGILMRTGAIGGTLPSMKEIQGVYATQSSGVG